MKIGTDIIEISRIADSVSKCGFLERVYSEKERLYFSDNNSKAETLAGSFCAKEAFMKAVGTGLRGISFNEISILHNNLGAPFISLSGKALELYGKYDAALSISHCKEYATATVILTEK